MDAVLSLIRRVGRDDWKSTAATSSTPRACFMQVRVSSPHMSKFACMMYILSSSRVFIIIMIIVQLMSSSRMFTTIPMRQMIPPSFK